MKIKIKRITETAIVPKYALLGDAGADLYSDEVAVLWPGKRRLVSTGVAVEIPLGYVGLVHPRSGLAVKSGISIVNSPGTIDSGYRGEIMINLINLGDSAVNIMPGDRVAQLVIQAVEFADFEIVDELEDSERGTEGHGSTGMV
jgi:dUTP pyrophosphatase